MRAVVAIVLAIWGIALFSQPALADKRVALVIGNSAYQNASRLTNPANDSGAMAATLKVAGFDVVELKRDLKANEMRRALRDFSDRVRGADVAIVYFAGHGIEIDGVNYVIPVDAILERDIDAFDEAIPLERILTVIEPARQLRLVILDACRDNPFGKSMKRTIASRAIGQGLAKVEPTSPNTLVAFAARAGSTASDGESKNSPFTAALIKYLPRPGLDLRKAFGFVRDEVLRVTNNKQEPFIYGSLGGDDVALVPAVVVAPPPAVDPNSAVRRDYELAERVGTRPVWDSFIANYPSGFYTDLAKAQRDRLVAEEARLAAVEKARAAAEEKKRLLIESDRMAEQAKAAAQAKAAEEARVAAEKKQAIEEARVAEAERVKAAAQAKAVEEARLAAEKVKAAEQAKAVQQRAALERKKALEEAKAAEVERAKAAARAKTEEDAKTAAANAKAAEEAKAAERARLAEQQKALEEAKAAEAERAKAAAQAKVEADARAAAAKAKAAEEAKAAEQARLAENQKALEEAKTAEAERARDAARAKQEATIAASDKLAVDKASDEKPIGPLAALTPPAQTVEAASKPETPAAVEIPRLLLTELRRVGCSKAAGGGNWDATAQKSLQLFNKNAGTKLDVRGASLDALDAVRGKPARVCPLVCDSGYRAQGEDCVKIVCKAGYELGDDNSCERIEVKKPKRPVATRAPSTEQEAPRNSRGTPSSPTAPRTFSAPAGTLSGEPPPGTIKRGERVVVQSSACPRGQVLELIGGDNSRNIPRQKRCISAN